MTWESSDRRSELPPDWDKRRAERLEYDRHRCVICGGRATDVDHVKRGNDHSFFNLQSLCAYCHMKKTQTESAVARREQRVKLRLDGGVSKKHPGLR